MALYVNGKQISGGGGGGNTNSVELTYAEYQALTPEQQLDGTEYFITDINGDGQQFQPIIYSEEEREIGVWVDGKPLYEKTLSFNPVAIAPSYDLPHGISDIDTVVDYDVFITRASTSNWTIKFAWATTNNSSTTVSVDSTNIRFAGTDNWPVNTYTKLYATLRYTKTTDQAGSGTWTPQGVPAHHYSNDEQVVGTWVDGSTLYEKTIDYTVNKSASHTFDFTDGNVKRVVGGFIINSLNSICFPVNCSWEGKTEEFLYDETHFYIKTSANLGDSNTLRIIVQYTKSST